MGRFFLWAFAIIGAITVLAIGLGIYAASRFTAETPSLPKRMVLELAIDGALSEQVAQDPVEAALFGQRAGLHTVIGALEAAAMDDRVAGLGLVFGPGDLPFTQAQELRDAVEKFRAAGKFVHAYSDTFGELGPANAPYYLASAAETIRIQPLGLVGLNGFAVEMPYVKNALGKIGVEAQTFRREEFKTAMNTFLETEMTAPERLMWSTLIEDMQRQLVGGIAAARNLGEAEITQAMARAPLNAADAKAAKLIDEVGYRDQYEAALRQAAGADSEIVDLFDYGPLAPRQPAKDAPIALIVAEGAIVRGEAEVGPFGDSELIGADDLSLWIDDAAQADGIEAIVLRVNSPGGSAIASETIRRSIQRAQENGKRVIVSMGEVAASGGYWIAMDADKIVAQPGTLTGSIGVYGGKFVTQRLWNDLEINWDEIEGAPQSNMWSPIEPFNQGEAATINALIDEIYTAFTDNVAAARNLPLDRIAEVAKGRVWTGAAAKELGLVDELGGLNEALDIAKAEIGRPAEETVGVRIFPQPEPAWARFLKLAESGGVQLKSLALLARIASFFEPIAAQIETQTPERNARMQPVSIR
jgi:protease-4